MLFYWYQVFPTVVLNANAFRLDEGELDLNVSLGRVEPIHAKIFWPYFYTLGNDNRHEPLYDFVKLHSKANRRNELLDRLVQFRVLCKKRQRLHTYTQTRTTDV